MSSTTYNLIKKDGCYYVEGLKDDFGFDASGDTLLLAIYEAGDCDTVRANGKTMHRALYDLYQTSDELHDGDTFAINGEVAYRCDGVHVVAA